MLDFIEALGPRVHEDPVVGIVACAPSGAGLSEAVVEASFERILGLGLQTAIYQLPQVTGNEISSGTISRLAARHANFIMIKDSSGEDHLAEAGLDLGGVFLVRGAEHGSPFPAELVSRAVQLLSAQGLLPDSGYMAKR